VIKTNDPKVFRLGIRKPSDILQVIIWFNVKRQRSRSQGHKVLKHIEDDRVAGVSLHYYRVPTI